MEFICESYGFHIAKTALLLLTLLAPNTSESFTLAMDYDSIHNIVGKDQDHIRTTPGGVDIPQHKTTYDWMYSYASSQPHAASLIGDRAYTYDANGNQTGWDHVSNGTRRTITWDEENRVQAIADNGHTLTYVYDDAGERVIKSGPQGETAYVNQFFVVRNREVATKHVFAGGTRLVSKMASQPDTTPPTAGNSGQAPWGWLHSNAGGNSPNSGGTVFEKDQYYFHPDHLGSSSYVTDIDGEIFQHLEYFPFGETWVEESSNTQRTPYLFTGKELDEETGLYYFGARYYDPRTSVWQSADPILAAYMGGSPNGGIFNPRKLSLYSYAQNRPVVLFDPNGLCESGFVGGGGTDASGQAWMGCRSETFWEGGPVRRFFANVLGDTYAGANAIITGNRYPRNPLSNEIVSGRRLMDAKVGVITGFFPAGKGTQAGAQASKGLIAKGAAFFRGGTIASTDDVLRLLPAPNMIKHHIFNAFHRKTAASQKYRDFFTKHGIDVDNFTVQMPQSLHQQWIHKAGNNWTTIWKRWIDVNPNATTQEVYHQAGRMMEDFGISARQLVPYRE